MKNKIILTILILSVIALVLSGCDGWDSVIPTIPDDVPVIEESITPNFGPPGTEVTIKGRNFGEINYLLTNPYLYYNVTFGNSLVIGMSWSDTQIIVEAPSDYGTGIQNASMAAAILRFFVTGKITELLEGFLPELVVLELDVGSEAWWKSWYKIAAAIGLPFVGVRPKEGEMDVIVTVETPAGSAEALFTYVVPPQPPTPLSPGSSSAPGPIIYTLTPTLTWAEVDNADYYDLAIKEYPYNTNIVYNFQEIYGSSFVVPSERLEVWKKYCWNVRAHNSNGFGNYSETLYFQIENVNELLTITTITASAGPNGSISPSGDQIVNQGSDKSFTITPDTGYQIDDVLVDGSSVGAVSSYTFTNITQNHTISATFSLSTATGLIHNLTKDTYYDTIQVALDDADDNNTIEVADGTYDESITFPSCKVITLQSVNGASSTIIRGNDDSATITTDASREGTTLEGFTITHVNGNYGRGILNNGNLIIKNCTISDNADYDGGGIYNYYGSLTITGSTISGNTDYDHGGGGIYNYYGSLTITGSTISGNTSYWHSGGGIKNYYGSLTITGSTISGNTGGFYGGGGIYNYYGSLTITGSTISNNSSGDGGGIYIIPTPVTFAIGGESPADKNTICGNYKSSDSPSLDQQIRDDSGDLYETYKDTNYISAYCD